MTMFVALKILLILFRPLIWITALFLWGLLSKRPVRKKRLLVLSFVLLAVFSNPWLIRSVVRAYEPPPFKDGGRAYPTGIVLGGFLSYDPKQDKGYFNASSDRFIQTALLYKTGKIKKVLFSGGNGLVTRRNFKESTFAREQLMLLGVPAEDIYVEDRSRNTEENARFSKEVIDSLHIPGPFLLISSAMHLPRGMYLYKKQGLDVTAYPCDFQTRGAGDNFLEDYLVPNSSALILWDNIIKEWLGLLTYKLKGV